MFSKFAKNSILVGQVDSYCLVCESYLRGEENLSSHVEKPVHTKKLEATGYFEKYKNDYIRKVKNGYFCGFCNLLLSTAAQVGLHVVDQRHEDNRGKFLLKRLDNDKVVYDNIQIKEGAWHGFIDDTCILCNVEFDKMDIHKTDHGHILKLIQSEVKFGPSKSVYRKTEENFYQCLTCNNVFSAGSFNEHFDSTDHKTTLKQSEITREDTTEKKCVGKKAPADVKLNGDINIPKNDNKQEPNIDSKQDKNKRKSQVTADKDDDLDKKYCEILGAKNYILKLEDKSELCIICHSSVNTSIAQHLNSKHHQALLKLHKERIEKNTKNRQEPCSEEGGSQKVEIKTDPETVKEETKETDSDVTENKNKILDSVQTFQKNEVNIDFITDTAVCKKCSMNVDFDYNAINNHIADHKKTADKKENKKQKLASGVQANGTNKNLYTGPVTMERDDKNAESYTDLDADVAKKAKENGLTYTDRKLYCNICNTQVPTSVRNIEQHISGSRHKSMIDQTVVKTVAKNKITKQLVEDFIENVTGVSDDHDKDIIINDKFCITQSSFIFIRENFPGVNCLCCDVQMHPSLLAAHISFTRHQKYVSSCSVITSLDSEFVREIKPDLFHCGFCNKAITGWQNMEEHLTEYEHKQAKKAADWRLIEHKRDIERHEQRKRMEYALLMRMLFASSQNAFNFNSDSD